MARETRSTTEAATKSNKISSDGSKTCDDFIARQCLKKIKTKNVSDGNLTCSELKTRHRCKKSKKCLGCSVLGNYFCVPFCAKILLDLNHF